MSAPESKKPAKAKSTTGAKTKPQDDGQLDLFADPCPTHGPGEPASAPESGSVGIPDEATPSGQEVSTPAPSPAEQDLAVGNGAEPGLVDDEPAAADAPISGDGSAASEDVELGGNSDERLVECDHARTPEGEERALTAPDEGGQTDDAWDNHRRDHARDGSVDDGPTSGSGVACASVEADSPAGVEDQSGALSSDEARHASGATEAGVDQFGVSVSREDVLSGTPSNPDPPASSVELDGDTPPRFEAPLDGSERTPAETQTTVRAISGDLDDSPPTRAAVEGVASPDGGNVSSPEKQVDASEPPLVNGPGGMPNTISGDHVSGAGGRDLDATDSTSGPDAHDRRSKEGTDGGTEPRALKSEGSRKEKAVGAGDGRPASPPAESPGKTKVPAQHGKKGEGTISAEAKWRRDHPEYSRLEVWLLRTDIERFKGRVKAAGMRGQEALEKLILGFLESDADRQNPPGNGQPPCA